jgi:hypothetical protein
MPDNQLSTMLMYLVGAVLASAIAIVGVGMFVGANRRFSNWLVPMISPVILVSIAIIAVLSNRNITNAEFEIGTAAGSETFLLTWFLRLSTFLVLGICLARFISVSQSHETRPRLGLALFLSFLFFYGTNALLNNFFGIRPFYDQKLIYPALVFVAVYLSRNKDPGYMVDATKWGLVIFCAASVAAIFLLPQAAVQRDYASVIPGVPFRLWGVGSNPNSTGPLALVTLLLLAHRPIRHRLLQLVAVGLGLAVLILAQSKTAWLAGLLAFPVLWWGKLLYVSAMNRRGAVYPLHQFLRPILICLLGLALVGALVYNQVYNPFSAIARDEQVTSLTGRTEIWAVAIETWKRNPLFGYGSSMWDDEFRRSIGMNFAYNAHNQFLQSLSVAGGLGLLGLLLYTFLLFRYALAANTATRGLSLALFLVIFVRYFTEAPLNLGGLFTGDFITHLLLFSLVLTKGRAVVIAQAPVYSRQYEAFQQYLPHHPDHAAQPSHAQQAQQAHERQDRRDEQGPYPPLQNLQWR